MKKLYPVILAAIGYAVFALCVPKTGMRRYRVELVPHEDELRARDLDRALIGENW